MTTSITIPTASTINWRTTYAETIINAPRQTVWDALINFDNYDAWNTFTYDVDMPRFAVGEEFSFMVKLGANERRQREHITAIEAPYMLAWRYPSETIFLKATRYQVLTDIDDGQTRYQTWETFSGLFTPILWLTVLESVQIGFNTVAQDLKRHCEKNLDDQIRFSIN